MDSRRLQYFVAVADHQGFSAAAKEVFVSQPALSLAVRELEDELGTPLFFRVGRRIALTPAGQALLGPARQLLHDLDVGRAAVAAVVGLEAGTLAICCLPTLAADPLAELIGSFRQAHPGIVIDLAAPEDTDEVVALIRDGSCEVGVATGVGASDLEQHPLGDQDLFVIFPPGTRRPRRTVALAELAGVPMIAAPKGTSTRRLLEEGFAATGSSATDRGGQRPARRHLAVGALRGGRRPRARADGFGRRKTWRGGGPASPPDLARDHLVAPAGAPVPGRPTLRRVVPGLSSGSVASDHPRPAGRVTRRKRLLFGFVDLLVVGFVVRRLVGVLATGHGHLLR